MNTLRFLSVICSAFLLSMSASAQSGFPDRDVSVVINFGAGGSTDVATRIVAHKMSADLGVPVVALNKPGAGGTLAPAYLKNQKPDGYTVGAITSLTQAIAPHIMKLSFVLDDFEYIAAFARYRYGLVVNANSPYKTVDDLVKAAKSDDGLFFGTPSAANTLAGLNLARLTGAKFEPVNYKSGTEVITALLSGQIDAAIQNPGDILPHLRAGTVRLLASAGPERWPDYNDVPTLKELGIDMQLVSWITLVAPKGTPEDAVSKIRAAAFHAVTDPDVREQFGHHGLDPVQIAGDEIRESIKEIYMEVGSSIKDSGLPYVADSCFVDCR